MPEDYRQEIGYFEVIGVVFSDCRCCLRMKSAQHLLTKECLPFRLTIAAGSLLITSLITILTPGVILHLTYGLQGLNRVRQQPMQLSHSMQTIRAASFTSSATFGALDIALRRSVFDGVCYVVYSVYD